MPYNELIVNNLGIYSVASFSAPVRWLTSLGVGVS